MKEMRYAVVLAMALVLLGTASGAPSGPAEVWHGGRLVGFAEVAEDGQITVVAGSHPDGAEIVSPNPSHMP